jgi:hypothetical protein
VLAAFPEFRTATAHGSNTVLFGPVADPTELRGLLARFDTLGLTVLEMRRLPD